MYSCCIWWNVFIKSVLYLKHMISHIFGKITSLYWTSTLYSTQPQRLILYPAKLLSTPQMIKLLMRKPTVLFVRKQQLLPTLHWVTPSTPIKEWSYIKWTILTVYGAENSEELWFFNFFSSGDDCLELIIRLSKKATLQKMICFGSNFTYNKILYQTTAFIFFPMCRVFMNYWILQFTQDISLIFVLPCTCFNFQYPI